MRKPGDTFERYTIEASIGQGGMGSVYQAVDAKLGRKVALKVIVGEGEGASPEASARLIREARAAAALDHPNAVSIFDVGESEGAPYIVMELVSGATLRRSIGDGSIAMSARTAWLGDVARALAAAHKRGIIHRDIKPENVMVRDDGVIKVLDFGIARRSGGLADPHATTESPALPTLTMEGARLGTPVYMAPEQIRGGALDGRADQFAWGVLAFELLTGRLPWRGAGDALAVVASILIDDPDRAELDKAGVSPGVRDVILRALAKRPDDRFASMEDAARALDEAARAPTDPAPTAASAAASPPPAKPTATDAQRFSTADVREVLGRAIERQAKIGDASRLGFDDVLAAAQEVGVDEATLREESRALREGDDRRPAPEYFLQESGAWLRRRRLDFFRHVGIYGIVTAALILLAILLPPIVAPFIQYVWILPVLWGIGVAIHGLIALTSNEDDFKERKAGLQWWLEERQRHHEIALARARSPRGARVPGPLPERRARLRVDVPKDTGASKNADTHAGADAEGEAEAEAAIEAEAPQKARRGRRR